MYYIIRIAGYNTGFLEKVVILFEIKEHANKKNAAYKTYVRFFYFRCDTETGRNSNFSRWPTFFFGEHNAYKLPALQILQGP